MLIGWYVSFLNKFDQLIDASFGPFFKLIHGQTERPTAIPSYRDEILHFCDVPGPPRGPIRRKSENNWLRTYGPTDGRTDPLIELRGRI